MFSIRLTVAVASIVWAWASMSIFDAVAREVYVNNILGDDLADGRSDHYVDPRFGPVRTIRRALIIADKGDRIQIKNTGHTYRESISLSSGRQSGFPDLPFTIMSDGAVLDGTVPMRVNGWEHVEGDVFRYRPRRVAFQQLFLGDQPAGRKQLDHVAGLQQGRGTLRSASRNDKKTIRAAFHGRKTWQQGEMASRLLGPLEWALLDGWIYFRVEPTELPSDYPLRCCGLQTGITLYHVHDVRIDGLVIRGFQLDGVSAHDGVRAAVVSATTCRDNGRSGMSAGGSSRLTIDGCTLAGNGRSDVRIEGLARVKIAKTAIGAERPNRIDVLGGQLRIDGKPWPLVDGAGVH
ncbi:MAG: right-handed parallel beta-helix repeat-containing protein [Pirellulales bacterium]